jgi:mannose-6-phosphate isomerase
VPVFKERVWGGSLLSEALGKELPSPDAIIGESWELVDLPDDQSRVAAGPLRGTSLHELVEAYPDELLGGVRLDGERFPLLVKYIDASQTLSVQVHPDAAAAAPLGGRPKSEAWYILDAAPEAVLYLGLKPGTTREALRRALEGGEDVAGLVNMVPVRPGDLFPVPPGTVHAIGAGILLAEVQQPSDTTYRVYDWGRVGLDGQPRQLHVDQALSSIHFDARPDGPRREGQVDMDLFHIELVTLAGGATQELSGPGPAVLVGLAGRGRVVCGPDSIDCEKGSVVLVPHAARGASELEAVGEKSMRSLLVTFPPEEDPPLPARRSVAAEGG